MQQADDGQRKDQYTHHSITSHIINTMHCHSHYLHETEAVR